MAALALRDRALQASAASFTVSDALVVDQPLVWANRAFTALTGYVLAEIIGRNCRFLHSPDTDPADREALRTAVREQRAAVVTILNRRKDGTDFWNDVSLSPVRDEDGVTTHFVAVQVDVTARVVAERQRRQARVAAAETSRRSLLLAEASRAESARLLAREHQIALGLQRSLLPVLPSIPGLLLAADYLPSDQDVQIGGDWWDVFALPDGSTGLAIGDVMGHDITAAAAMGQLRSVLRTCAWSGASPAEVLDQLDRLVQHFDMAQFATCAYARLEPGRVLNGRLASRLTWASAGHLPMVLLRADRLTATLREGRGLPLGVPGVFRHEQAHLELYDGDSVLLFTDGLVETRHGDIESDLERLLHEVWRHLPQDGPRALVDRLTAGLGRLDDDVAVLAVQVARPTPPAGQRRRSRGLGRWLDVDARWKRRILTRS